MKKLFALFLAIVLCLPSVAGIPVQAADKKEAKPTATGTVYYVDSNSGSDENAGTSKDAPWKTIGKVNSMVFEPGDAILFKAGSVWTGEQLMPQGNGTETEPITIGRYGSDSEYPALHGSALPGSGDFSGPSNKTALLLKDVSNWIVQDLEITNYGFCNSQDDSDAQKERSGVYLEVTSGHVMENITLDGLYIHDVNGYNWKHNTAEGAGIRLNALHTSGTNDGTKENSSWFDGLIIENCYLENVMRNGITQYYDYGGHPWGHAEGDQQWFSPVRSKNVVIRGNVLKDVAGDGIKLWGTDGALVESNLVIHAGAKPVWSNENSNLSAAVWAFDSNETVFQYNEVCYTGAQRGTSQADSQAFDGDYYCVNTLFQYNYSHDNEGGFLLVCGPEYAYSDGTVVRYNISENDVSVYGRSTVFQIGGGGGVDHTRIYNNTVYVDEDQAGNSLVNGEEWDGTPRGTWFENNIFYVDGKLNSFGFAGHASDKGQEGIVTYDNNLYAGSFFDPENLPADMPEDPNAVFGDPEFVSAGNAGDGYRSGDGTLSPAAVRLGPGYYAAGAYKIQEGSAAIGAGKIIDQSQLGQKLGEVVYYPGNSSEPVNKGEYFGVSDIVWKDYNGGRDFFGNVLLEGKKPDIGAHQYSGSTESKNLSAFCDWLAGVSMDGCSPFAAEQFQEALEYARKLLQGEADSAQEEAAYDALESAYRRLKADPEITADIQEVCEKIDEILVTGKDGERAALEAIWTAYQELQEDGKRQVTKKRYDKLLEAMELADLVKEKGASLMVKDQSANEMNLNLGAEANAALRVRDGIAGFRGHMAVSGEEATKLLTETISGTNPFTIEAVINPNGYGYEWWDYNMIASKGDRSAVFRVSEQSVYFCIYNTDGEWKWVKVPLTEEQMNAWLHVAAIYDGENISVYVQDLGYETAAGAGSVAASDYPLGIGCCPETERHSDMDIRMLRVYQEALTKEQLDENSLSPNDEQAVLWYDFDDYGYTGIDSTPVGLRTYTEQLELNQGEQEKADVVLAPYYARGEIRYAIGDTTIASVDKDGMVIGLKAGHTVLTATAAGQSLEIPVIIGRALLEKAGEVEKLIAAIGQVVNTEACGQAIEKAKAAYDALTEEEKELVKNAAVLTEAQSRLQELKEEEARQAEDQVAASAVENQIAAIGEVKLESEAAIKAAREAYNRLTAVQKALITNLPKLTEAENRLAQLKAARSQDGHEKIRLSRPKLHSVKGNMTKKGLVRVKLTFTKAENGQEMAIYRKVGKKVKRLGTTRAGVFYDKKPVSGKKATYYVQAVAKDASRYADSPLSVRKTISIPANTKKLKAKQYGKAVQLTWKNVKGAKKYYIYRSFNPKKGYKRIGVVKASKNRYADRKVKAGKKYYYKVITCRSNVYSMGKRSNAVKIINDR